jgi:hypothetical protein
MFIDNRDSGNKMIVVTGTLSLYGNAPNTIWTYLLSTVSLGSTSILVESCTGWNVGDQLVIGPTFINSSHTEYVTITNIFNNNITFSP